MKNRIENKNVLILSIIIFLTGLVTFSAFNIYEYHSYNKNFNKKLLEVVTAIRNKYPDMGEDEVTDIILSDNLDEELVTAYSIDLPTSNLLKENSILHTKYLIYTLLLFSLFILLIIFIYTIYNKKRSNKINDIVSLIKKINNKIYDIDIRDMREDEISILKSEIYKTTIMLKQEAENSTIDKVELKKSLSDISHQLKTPLTSISIILDNLLENEAMDAETRNIFLREIKRETININFLVQNILKLSKLDTNTVIFNSNTHTLEELINSSLKNISIISEINEVKVVTDIVKTTLKIDLKWQSEAISNVLKNSIEHSPKGSVIEVTTRDTSVFTEIKIRDHGTGIDEADLNHIFERFYKTKNAKSDSIGIGLSLTKSIIEKENGSISVTSNNKGTTFKIRYYK